MDKAYTNVGDKVVIHTHNEIIGYHEGADIEQFIEQQSYNYYEYHNIKKYLETVTNDVLEDDLIAQAGVYGVRVVWGGEVHLLSYNYGDLQYVSPVNGTDYGETIIELVNIYNKDGWQDVVSGSDIETMVNTYFKGASYIVKYKLASWLDLMMNKVREDDFVDELIETMDQLLGINLKKEDTLDGYNVYYGDLEVYKVNTHTIKGSRFTYFSELFKVLNEQGILGRDESESEETCDEITKALVTVKRGVREVDTLRGLHWEDGQQQFRQRVITAVQELTTDGDVDQITLGFTKGSHHIQMEFSDYDGSRRVMLVGTIEELEQYDDSEIEVHIVNGKEIHQIKIQIGNILHALY